MRYLLVPPQWCLPRRLHLPTHPLIVKKSRVTAQFASPSLSRKRKTLYGVVLRVGIIYTRTASSSGQRAKPAKRFDVCIGKMVLDATEMTDLTDVLPAVRHGRETRNRSNESRRPGKLMARDM